MFCLNHRTVVTRDQHDYKAEADAWCEGPDSRMLPVKPKNYFLFSVFGREEVLTFLLRPSASGTYTVSSNFLTSIINQYYHLVQVIPDHFLGGRNTRWRA